MNEIQRCKNETNLFDAYWIISCWKFLIIKVYERLSVRIEVFTNLNATKFYIYTIQCAFNKFISFLKCWIPLIKNYNFISFIVYYIFWLKYIFEKFNCIILDNLILNGIRTVILRNFIENFHEFCWLKFFNNE